MTRIRVMVTAEDIAAAEARREPGRCDGSSCPLALAVHSAGFPLAHVARQYWNPNVDDSQRLWDLSKRATAFIDRFDAGKPVQPAAFYLQGPDR